MLHVIAYPDHADKSLYIGILFLLYATAAILLSAAILFESSHSWTLASVLAGAGVILYVLARTTGLPGYMEDDWLDPVGNFSLGLVTVLLEAVFLVLSAIVSSGRWPGAGSNWHQPRATA